MDKQKVREFRVDLEAALSDVAKQHGFESISVGTIRFSDAEITGRFRVVVNADKHSKQMNVIHGSKIQIGSVIEFAQNFYKVTGYTAHGHYIVVKSGSSDSRQYRISKKYTDKIKIVEQPTQ